MALDYPHQKYYQALDINPELRDEMSDKAFYRLVSQSFRSRYVTTLGHAYSFGVGHSLIEAWQAVLTDNRTLHELLTSTTNGTYTNIFPPAPGQYFSLFDIDKIIAYGYELEDQQAVQPLTPEAQVCLAFAHHLEREYFVYVDQAIESTRRSYRHYGYLVQQRWRRYLLELFGQESLNDYVMRHMLVFGLQWRYLLWRKLLNPVKWAAAIVCLTTELYICLIKCLKYHVADLLIGGINRLRRKSDDELIAPILKGALLVLTLTATVILFPVPTLLAMIFAYGLCVFARTAAQVIAMPINKLLRPAVQLMSEHPLLTVTFLVYKVTTLVAALMASIFYPPFALFLAANELKLFGLSVLFGLPTSYLSYRLNNISSGIGYLFAPLFSCALFLSFSNHLLATGALLFQPVLAIGLLGLLFGIVENIIDTVEAERGYTAYLRDNPKMPALEPPQKFFTSLKQGGALARLTQCSHEFFTTNKDCPELEPEQRGLSYQFCSVIGVATF
jgi:hypothetical protein